MNIRLDGKHALVTGGNSGIGEAIVLALAEAGAKVAINYVAHPDVAESLAKKIRDQGAEALTVEADVRDAEAVAGMFRCIDAAWGGIDIVVNNAGIDGTRALAWEIDPDDWQKVMDVNLMGTLHCAREALRRMVAQKSGIILNMSSVHEQIAWSGYSAYVASKAAVGMLTKTLAQEAAPYNVRVLAIGPGAIKTAINQTVWSDSASMQDLADKIPLRRMGRPDEIARMAVVLASDVASYMTGCTIYIDGGMLDYPGFAHGG